MHEYFTSVDLNVFMYNYKYTQLFIIVWYHIFVFTGKLKLVEWNGQLWWMSWLQFTACKQALPSCHISIPLDIMWLYVRAVYLFCSPFPHFVPCLPTNLPKSLPFSIFQFQLLPLERGLMNVAHIRVTSEITPPFFSKKIHQAESASSRDVWFSTQGECLSQRSQMARYWWGLRRTGMCCSWNSQLRNVFPA